MVINSKWGWCLTTGAADVRIFVPMKDVPIDYRGLVIGSPNQGAVSKERYRTPGRTTVLIDRNSSFSQF